MRRILTTTAVVSVVALAVPAAAGAAFGHITSWGSLGSADGLFNVPRGMGVDRAGNVYVADDNNRIAVFNNAGAFIRNCGSYGSGPGAFFWPSDVAVDDLGYIFVADLGNHRVQVLGPIDAGKPCAFVREWTFNGADKSPAGPYGIAVDRAGDVYVTGGGDANGQLVRKYTPHGDELVSFGGNGTGPGQFRGYMHPAVDVTGTVFVTDFANDRVQRFSSAGVYLSSFGDHGTANGLFYGPSDIAIDAAGSVWVPEFGINHRFQQFTRGGDFVAAFGGEGTGPGQFTSVNGVATDGNCNVFVSDTSSYGNPVQRVEKWGQSEPPFCRAPAGSGSGTDGRRPVIRFTVSIDHALRRGVISISALCPSEDCVIRGLARIAVPAGSSVYRLSAGPVQAAEGEKVRLRIRIGRKLLHKLRRRAQAGHSIPARLTVKATDGSGNVARKHKRVYLR